MHVPNEAIIDAIQAAEGLKRVPRLGWVTKVGLRSPESVADHSYALAVMCLVYADLHGLDSCKMVKMALLHDLCESLTGDIQPGDLSPDKKHRTERRALAAIFSAFPPKLRDDYLKTFDDFNEGSSRESSLVRQLDKVEMAAQAIEYQKNGHGKMTEFLRTAEASTTDAELTQLLSNLKLLKRRA